MNYNPVLEIMSILKLNDETQQLTELLEIITKELNFKLGNIKNKNFDSYQKEIDIDGKKRIIKIKKLNQQNELEMIYQQNSSFISIKINNDKTDGLDKYSIKLNRLSIMYPHGLYILDNNNINYYDRETIDYIREKEQKTKDTPFIELKDITDNGLLPKEKIKLPNKNIEQIELFKNLITNTKEENEKLLENKKKNKNKQKILTYN